jgi:CubicO group peptidase (beta-lactamase class C family)
MRPVQMVAGFAVVALSLPLLNRAAAADRGAHFEELADAVRAGMHRSSAPGLAIMVVDDQTTLWSGYYGVTGKGGAPVSRNTVFRVGSVSKPVTAAAVMRYIERGALKLDDPVERLLPVFKPRSPFAKTGAPITVRALLAHHSGLPGDSFRGMWDRPPAKVCDAMPVVAGEWLVEAPQTQYRYSNLDFTTLGCLMETASRRSFVDAIRKDLLAPLGMTASTYGEPAVPRPRLAQPHRGGKPALWTGLRDVPAGSLSATAEDMGKLLRMLLGRGEINGKNVLKRASVAQMFTRQFDDGGWPYAAATGLGWMLSGQPIAGSEAVWHSGQYPGYFAHIALLPDKRLGVVVLANDDNAREFVPKLAVKALEIAYRVKTGIPAPKQTGTPAPPAEVHLDDAAMERCAGRYAVFDDIIRVRREGGALKLKFQGQDIELRSAGEDKFVPRAQFLFGLINWKLDGITVRMTSRAGRQFAVVEGITTPLVFEKVQAGGIPDAWRRRLGAWRVTNPDGWLHIKTVRLALDDGGLVMDVVTSSPLWGVGEGRILKALRPVGENLALTVSTGMGGGAVEAATRYGRETLIYSGYVLERISEDPR